MTYGLQKKSHQSSSAMEREPSERFFQMLAHGALQSDEMKIIHSENRKMHSARQETNFNLVPSRRDKEGE